MIIATLIVVSLILYFVGDRITPYTSQATIGTFLVQIAPQVSGQVHHDLCLLYTSDAADE